MQRTPAHVVELVALEGVLITAIAAAQRGLSLCQSLLRAQLGQRVNVMILEKALTLDLGHFEDSEFYDKLTRARREASTRPLSLVTRTFGLVQNGISLASYAALLSHFSPWAVVVLMLAGLPAFIAETKFSGDAFRLFRWRSPETRMQIYLETVLAREDHAKEVKLYGLGPRLLERYRDIFRRLYKEDRSLTIRRDVWGFGLGLIGTVAFYAAYAWIAVSTVRQAITLGQMTMYVALFRQGQSAVSAILSAVGGMYEDNLYLSTLYEYLETPVPAPAGAATKGPLPQDGIRFEDVSFTYPGAEQPALEHITLHLAPGGSLALVGENGSGKTTLIKLLTRLYQPTSGRILLDGRDLAEWEEQALRERIGVIFQDFTRYQMLVGENVGAGDERYFEDEPRWREAAEKGMASAFIDTLPSRLPDATRQVVQGRPRALGRPVAEDRARPVVHAHPRGHPGVGRADRGDGCPGRSRHLRALPSARQGPDHDPHFAPVLHGAYGGPDRGPRSWAHRRERQSRGAHEARRPLCAPVHPAGARLPLGAEAARLR
jgi:ATP-binding cassette subfamily B protein